HRETFVIDAYGLCQTRRSTPGGSEASICWSSIASIGAERRVVLRSNRIIGASLVPLGVILKPYDGVPQCQSRLQQAKVTRRAVLRIEARPSSFWYRVLRIDS